MNVDRPLLAKAAEHGVISASQADALWLYLTDQVKDTPSFRATHILYYLGGSIAIGAMSLFMNLGWERFGGWGLFAIALAYAAVGIGLTEFFLRRQGLRIPAGICGAFVVALTPLAIYGVQAALGHWTENVHYPAYHTRIEWRWMFMELGTLATGAVMLWRYRLPFLVIPVAVTLWYMSMDLTPFLFGTEDRLWVMRRFVSLWFGLLMTLLAFWVDVRRRRGADFPFWLYLFGVLAFWGGLTAMRSDNELDRLGYFGINLAMIAVSAVLSRRVFVVFGGLGATMYIGHLASAVFKNSVLFPFVLTAIGFGVIYLGILWQRHEARISAQLRVYLPAALRELVEREQ